MSQESYRLFINICDLYLVLLQVMLFLVVWDIFFRPEKGKKEMLSAGIFAAVNVLLRLCPGVPGWVRYAVSAAAALGYCRIRYKGCLEKAVFTLLLFYNFHGMSFLVSNSLYQFLMDGLMGRLDVRNAEYMLHMYKSQVIGQGCNILLYTLSFVSMTWILKKIVKSPVSMSWQDAIFLPVKAVLHLH